MYNLKYNRNEHIYKTETGTENRRGCQGREGERGKNWEFGISRYTPLEWINSKVLPYSTGNYIPYFVTDHNGKNREKYIYINMYN